MTGNNHDSRDHLYIFPRLTGPRHVQPENPRPEDRDGAPATRRPATQRRQESERRESERREKPRGENPNNASQIKTKAQAPIKTECPRLPHLNVYCLMGDSKDFKTCVAPNMRSPLGPATRKLATGAPATRRPCDPKEAGVREARVREARTRTNASQVKTKAQVPIQDRMPKTIPHLNVYCLMGDSKDFRNVRGPKHAQPENPATRRPRPEHPRPEDLRPKGGRSPRGESPRDESPRGENPNNTSQIKTKAHPNVYCLMGDSTDFKNVRGPKHAQPENPRPEDRDRSTRDPKTCDLKEAGVREAKIRTTQVKPRLKHALPYSRSPNYLIRRKIHMGMPNIREARSRMPLPPGGPEMSRGDTSLRPPPPSRANVISNTLLAHRNAWKNLTWAGTWAKSCSRTFAGVIRNHTCLL